jgi:ABC-2 type transport system permease protein
LGYVVLFLLPLWVLFVSYDLVSGEKSRGTLKIAFTSGSSRSNVFAAKLVSSLLAVWTPTVAAILLGLLAGTYTYHAPWADASRLLLFASILTAYILFYLCVGVLASTCTDSPRTSLAVVMTVWAFFSFVQPRATVLAASLLRPSPSTVAFEIKKRAALAEARRGYVEEHHSGAAQNWMLERLVVAAEAIRREQALQRVHDDARTSAHGLVDAFMLFSPFGLTQSALVQVAGTDTSRYDRFRQACNEYRWQLTRHFVGAYEASKLQGVDPSTVEVPRSAARKVLDNTPRSGFREDDLRTLLLRVSARISALLALAMVLGVAALRNFWRYDAR